MTTRTWPCAPGARLRACPAAGAGRSGRRLTSGAARHPSMRGAAGAAAMPVTAQIEAVQQVEVVQGPGRPNAHFMTGMPFAMEMAPVPVPAPVPGFPVPVPVFDVELWQKTEKEATNP